MFVIEDLFWIWFICILEHVKLKELPSESYYYHYHYTDT